MILSTSDPAHVGVYPGVTVTMSISRYPGVTAYVTNEFTVTVTCEVMTLTLATAPPASTTVQVGIDT